jgi:uncharacterized OB-fold protein
MTWLEPQSGQITSPYPGVLSQPYWDACRRGELTFQRCADCGGATHTPAVVCAHCTSTALSWEVSSGRGTVYSWTTVWRAVTPAFVAPYVVVIVDVEEGWQMLANLIDCEHDAVQVGLPVTVTFHPLPDGAVLPYFRPAAE